MRYATLAAAALLGAGAIVLAFDRAGWTADTTRAVKDGAKVAGLGGAGYLLWVLA